jgi:hypothetical protein
MRTLIRAVLALLAVAVVGVVALALVLRHAPVAVTAGPAADAVAHQVERAVDADAWARTRAVRWTAKGGREHLWDRDRGLARVRFAGHEVLIDLGRRTGRAWTDGREIVEPGAQRALVDKAYRWHVNDAFWLNPLVKLFDSGVTRSLGTLDGHRVLQVHYASGGVTPGDRYQWILDERARPLSWRVWASVLPIPGMEFTWGVRSSPLRTRAAPPAWPRSRPATRSRRSLGDGVRSGVCALRRGRPHTPDLTPSRR